MLRSDQLIYRTEAWPESDVRRPDGLNAQRRPVPSSSLGFSSCLSAAAQRERRGSVPYNTGAHRSCSLLRRAYSVAKFMAVVDILEACSCCFPVGSKASSLPEACIVFIMLFVPNQVSCWCLPLRASRSHRSTQVWVGFGSAATALSAIFLVAQASKCVRVHSESRNICKTQSMET